MLTEHPARILGRGRAAVAAGAPADLIVWEAERAEDVIAALAARRLIVKGGRVSVEHHRSVDERWRRP